MRTQYHAKAVAAVGSGIAADGKRVAWVYPEIGRILLEFIFQPNIKCIGYAVYGA